MSTVRKLISIALLAGALFLLSFGASFMMGAAIASAQPADESGSTRPPVEPAEAAGLAHDVPGDDIKAEGPGKDAHGEAAHGHHDPSQDFNFFGSPFEHRGKDIKGGVYGDGKMVDPHTGEVISEEEPMSAPFVWMVVNFVILLGLLAWKGGPVARKIAVDRHDQIKTALDEAAKLRKQAADKLAEYEVRLKDADLEIKKMVEGMRLEAEADKKRILENAEKQAILMKREAELRIAAEIEAARVSLTREVTMAAVTATENLLREKMMPADQQKLVTTFIGDVQTAAKAGDGRNQKGAR